jgi:hypothetical protein
MENEAIKIILTILGTFATTLLTLGKWARNSLRDVNTRLYTSIDALNKEMNGLKASISELDKNLAVQTAIFQQVVLKRGDYP